MPQVESFGLLCLAKFPDSEPIVFAGSSVRLTDKSPGDTPGYDELFQQGNFFLTAFFVCYAGR